MKYHLKKRPSWQIDKVFGKFSAAENSQNKSFINMDIICWNSDNAEPLQNLKSGNNAYLNNTLPPPKVKKFTNS